MSQAIPWLRHRPRRLRQSEPLRHLVQATRLSADQLIMPLFVRPGRQVRAPIPSMPGQCQLSIDQLVHEAGELYARGVPAVLLFGLPERKDELGRGAYADDGIVQQAVRSLKLQVPKLLVLTDVCLCAYTTHGHCGILRTQRKSHQRGKGRGAGGRGLEKPAQEFWIDNDATLPLLAKTAISHVKAGADLVAPSDMMDGTVGAIRSALDHDGLSRTPILAYSAKFASAFYAPFRQAADSAPAVGDRRSYQLDPANLEEAVREAAADIEQGADIVMVKPALAYLDVIRVIKDRLRYPVAAFNVSGEYVLVKAAGGRGWLPERAIWMEMLLAIKRAGADLIITYWAKEAAVWLRDSSA